MVPLTDSQAIIHTLQLQLQSIHRKLKLTEPCTVQYSMYVALSRPVPTYCRVPPMRRCYFSTTVLVQNLQNPPNHTEIGVPQRLGFYLVGVGGGWMWFVLGHFHHKQSIPVLGLNFQRLFTYVPVRATSGRLSDFSGPVEQPSDLSHDVFRSSQRCADVQTGGGNTWTLSTRRCSYR